MDASFAASTHHTSLLNQYWFILVYILLSFQALKQLQHLCHNSHCLSDHVRMALQLQLPANGHYDKVMTVMAECWHKALVLACWPPDDLP